MEDQTRNETAQSSPVYYETLEPWARMKVQAFVQPLLEEEVSALLRRGKHARREGVSAV